MTKELEEDIEHELKWLNSPCRATREEARANLFKIINNLEKPTCNTCKYNTVGQDEYIWGLEEQVKELEKENARLKDGIALKDEEIGCIETDFNTFKSKASEIIVTFLGLMQTFGYSPSMDKFIIEAKQFIEE